MPSWGFFFCNSEKRYNIYLRCHPYILVKDDLKPDTSATAVISCRPAALFFILVPFKMKSCQILSCRGDRQPGFRRQCSVRICAQPRCFCFLSSVLGTHGRSWMTSALNSPLVEVTSWNHLLFCLCCSFLQKKNYRLYSDLWIYLTPINKINKFSIAVFFFISN